ncbi:MAG: two-component system, OmpR family, sensor histidine kinase CpxA [Blastocatellia bacterium]|jgi:two-component system sensor histidine kinase CpxA|nr:two-component system, OmpR family, sensor histidine kinase CpxA [Blastocatellia bacterium]
MRSLFLKIFLWFGLAMVLVNVGSFVIGVVTERQSQPPRSSPMAPMFGVYAQTAAEILERDGQGALAAYLERIERASRIRAMVLDARGEEVAGRTVPEDAKELSKRVTESAPFVFAYQRHQQQPFAAQLVHTPGGASYILVGELPRPDFPRPPPRLGEPGSFLFGLRLLGQRLLPVLLIGALFCYLLARYLTTPIVKLRNTTQELAGGNLSARVSHGLSARRDEIGYLGRDFNLMAERIESLVELQRRLLRDISHELRSPLTRLGVALELVRRRAGPEVSTGLDRIGREAQSINEMIGQLLTLSRVESGAGKLEDVRIDLCALVQNVAGDADFEARSRNRSVRIITCEDCTVNGVFELLRSAVENVVRNAVHYTAEGTEVEIKLSCEDADGKSSALINVRDHGAGVPQESIAEIFRPFYRVEDARDRQTGGTGLGLAIAARAVFLHDGTIKAANAPDGGLIVEIRLPLRS